MKLAGQAAIEREAELQHRLGIATAMLRDIAAHCGRCAGRGELRETLQAFTMTDDPRVLGPEPYPRWGRRSRARQPSRVQRMPIGAGVLVTPCPDCLPIRQVIETVGGPL